MKNILLIGFITISLNAKIHFFRHLNPAQNDIALSVTNVDRNDVLNLRLEPSIKSKILYHIPYDAKNLTTYDKDILKKLGKNRWVPIRLGFEEGYLNGWVKGKYLKIYEKYGAVIAGDLLIIYPKFLIIRKIKNGYIELLDTIEFEHYSGCDTKSHPKLLDELNRFDLKFKVYYSLLDFFVEENIENYKDITQRGWFKPHTSFAKRVNYFGLKGYKNSIGAEGCGINRYFFKINGKILVIQEPFDDNPPIIQNLKKLPNNLKMPDKQEIIRFIIKNLRVF